MEVCVFDSLPSTNQYCELLDLDKVEEFAVFLAKEQTAGIGQRGNCWVSHAGENLTFSIVLKPSFLPFADQFLLTQAVSLGLTDCLAPLLQANNVDIKWPNDIYVGQQKICGILISNKIRGGHVAASIVGIGLNVNQTRFPEWLPNPVSLKLLTHTDTDLRQLLTQLSICIKTRYRQLAQGETDKLRHDYLARLLNLGVAARYRYQGQDICAVIQGVNRFGHLLLRTSEGESLVCQLREISFLP